MGSPPAAPQHLIEEVRGDVTFVRTDPNLPQVAIIDRCLQVFGGYGYLMEYPIAQMYAAARVQKIYGGTNEIMKELISRKL